MRPDTAVRKPAGARPAAALLLGFRLAAAAVAADYSGGEPTWTPAAVRFAGGSLRPRIMNLTRDGAAPTGQAGLSRVGTNQPGTVADSYSYEQIPGRYRTTFLFKVESPEADTPIVDFFIWGAVGRDPRAGAGAGDPWSLRLCGRDFHRPGTYEPFVYQWEYYEAGFMVMSASWLGQADLWWGGCQTELVEAFDDDTLLEKWRHPPDQPFYVPFPPSAQPVAADLPPGRRPPAGPPAVFVVEGMYFDCFGIEEAVRSLPDARLESAATRSGAQVSDICPGFPPLADLIGRCNVLVLANVDIRRLGVPRRHAIREFVRHGGGLLVLGGPWTYGRTALGGTWIDQMLPVATTPGPDWVETTAGTRLAWTAAVPDVLRGGVPARRLPVVRYLHAATVRPGGQILMTAGERPALVSGACGDGRVLTFLGTPMGEGGEGGEGFWESPDWPPVMARLLAWLAGGP